MSKPTPVQIDRVRSYRVDGYTEDRDDRYCLLMASGLEVSDD